MCQLHENLTRLILFCEIMYTWIKDFTCSVAPKLLLSNTAYVSSRIIASVFEPGIKKCHTVIAVGIDSICLDSKL